MKNIINNNHPAIRKQPPMGVIGPKKRRLIFQCSANDRKQMLKEKKKTPTIKQIAAHFSTDVVNDRASPTINNTMA